MAKIRAHERLQLWIRAGVRCEYCRSSVAKTQFHIEHVTPRALGGTDDLSNLAISCARCNTNKGDSITGLDPIRWTGESLFNPRLMVWEEHFVFGADPYAPCGITPVGRATAASLFRFTSAVGPPDLRWDKLAGISTEDTYTELNFLRFLRHQNRFSELESHLRQPLLSRPGPEDLDEVECVRSLLSLELMYTRSRPSDVAQGIAMARRLFERRTISATWRAEFANALSVLLDQRATLRACEGRHDANADKDEASDWQTKSILLVPNALSTDAGLIRQLRSTALRARLSQSISAYDFHESERQSGDVDGYTALSAVRLLADMSLADDSLTRERERIYAQITKIQEASGYATGARLARNVNLRRRWWMLTLLLEQRPDMDSLKGDAEYWRSLTMHHELRSLQEFVSTRPQISASVRADVLSVL